MYKMKYLISIVKYYVKGFIIAAVIGFILVLYGLFFDDSYSFIDFSLYMQVNSIMAMPCGLHLWIIKLLDNPEAIKNKYEKFLFTILSHYWIGLIFSFLLVISIQFISYMNDWESCYYLIEASILWYALLIGIPIGLLLYFIPNLLNLRNFENKKY